ncbi:MAG: diaminopimelate epimerase [Chitinophagaceae bacterium]
MAIPFTKYQGTGNDFIIIDNRDNKISLSTKQIEKLCHRRFGIGADGLMLLEKQDGFDFNMVYYNSDGNPGSMCGNGGRCITRFAHDLGIRREEYNFLASDGPHKAWIDEKFIVRLKMQDVTHIENHSSYELLNTGSPHFVKMVADLHDFPVYKQGHEIRNSEKFREHGVNVNFVEMLDEDRIFVRTYERGVEDETFSCGTGVTAAAIVNAHNDRGFNHIDIKTRGGELFVEFDKMDDERFENIWLCGPAVKVFDGGF